VQRVRQNGSYFAREGVLSRLSQLLASELSVHAHIWRHTRTHTSISAHTVQDGGWSTSVIKYYVLISYAGCGCNFRTFCPFKSVEVALPLNRPDILCLVAFVGCSWKWGLASMPKLWDSETLILKECRFGIVCVMSRFSLSSQVVQSARITCFLGNPIPFLSSGDSNKSEKLKDSQKHGPRAYLMVVGWRHMCVLI